MIEEHANRYYLPEHFDVSFRPFLGTRKRVRFDGLQLVCRLSLWRRVRVCPSVRAWGAFWQEMDEVRLWQWNATYRPAPNSVVYDGLRWNVEIIHGERQITSEGHNAYPGNSENTPRGPYSASPDKAQESARFRKFREALHRLTGVDLFG